MFFYKWKLNTGLISIALRHISLQFTITATTLNYGEIKVLGVFTLHFYNTHLFVFFFSVESMLTVQILTTSQRWT